MSDLVGDPEAQISRVAVQLIPYSAVPAAIAAPFKTVDFH